MPFCRSGRALSCTVHRVRPSTSPRVCSFRRRHVQPQCLPQQAQQRLPLAGRPAGHQSRVWTADEHTVRPRSWRLMLRHHLLIMRVDGSRRPLLSTGIARVPCASATCYACERLYLRSDYPCASPVRVGPAQVAVSGRRARLTRGRFLCNRPVYGFTDLRIDPPPSPSSPATRGRGPTNQVTAGEGAPTWRREGRDVGARARQSSTSRGSRSPRAIWRDLAEYV